MLPRIFICITFLAVVKCSDEDVSITLKNMQIVNPDVGDLCVTCEGGIQSCAVLRGMKVALKAVFVISGGKYTHLGIDSLRTTIKWNHNRDVVTDAQTCQKVGGDLVINGECSVTVMVEGNLNLVPYEFTIPNSLHRGKERLYIYVDADWSDGTTKTINALAGKLDILVL